MLDKTLLKASNTEIGRMIASVKLGIVRVAVRGFRVPDHH